MLKRAYVEITNICNLRCSFCPGTGREIIVIDPITRIITQEGLCGSPS